MNNVAVMQNVTKTAIAKSFFEATRITSFLQSYFQQHPTVHEKTVNYIIVFQN